MHFSWPLLGFLWLIRRPALWLRPVLGMAVIAVMAGSVGGGVGWWLWPDASHAGWAWLGWAGLALGGGLGAAVACGAVLVPLLMALVLDTLAAAVRRDAGMQVVEMPPAQAVGDALAVFVASLPSRVGWTVLAIAGGFLGPFGLFVAAYAAARMATADALDTALAAEGAPRGERLAARRIHGAALGLGSVTAAGMQLGLALALVAWLWWLPALVCGASLYRLPRRE